MSHVLVTGATGFIGKNLVETLVGRGDRVRCLVRSPDRAGMLRDMGAELVEGDLDQPSVLAQAVAGTDVVYHLAAVTKTLRAEEMFHVNRDGTANLMRACAEQSRPPVVVLVSSIAAAGPAPRGQLRTESDPPAPVSNYGRSKLEGEQAAEQFADRVPHTIVRPGAVFGPRDPGVLEAFLAIRRFRSHVTPGVRPPPLSWIYVGDLIELMIRAAERGKRVPAGQNGAPGQGRYFATCSEYITWAEMGRLVRPMLRRPFAPLILLPGPLAWCLAGAGEGVGRLYGKAFWLNYDKIREALVPSWACSGEAAKRDLDFTPPKPLVERFSETIEWYKREKWL
jgi:nucleoside-diphosphate-sugar epimerase